MGAVLGPSEALSQPLEGPSSCLAPLSFHLHVSPPGSGLHGGVGLHWPAPSDTAPSSSDATPQEQL